MLEFNDVFPCDNFLELGALPLHIYIRELVAILIRDCRFAGDIEAITFAHSVEAGLVCICENANYSIGFTAVLQQFYRWKHDTVEACFGSENCDYFDGVDKLRLSV